jgi:LppP/LprE lipoprotein
MFQLFVRTGIPVGVAAALLFAACGGQSGPSGSGARHGSSPTPSSALGQPAAEPTAHPPALASPANASAAYATAADAERFLGANGLSADAPEQTWRPSAVLHVLHATGSGGADYQGDWYFFFVSGRLVGQRFFSHASNQSPVDEATFSVSYNVFHPGDPHCCPSGGQTTVRFHWNGTRLTTLDPVPGAIQT